MTVSRHTEKFHAGLGPYVIAQGCEVVSGAAATNIGANFGPMTHYPSVLSQKCEPQEAAALGQNSLDTMSRLLVFSGRNAGDEADNWQLTFSFSRNGISGLEFQNSIRVPLQGVQNANNVILQVIEGIPHNFLGEDLADTTAISDVVGIRARLLPGADLTDTAVWWSAMLVPAFSHGHSLRGQLYTGRGALATLP